jgi:cytochrome c-type biogenesis protein CcsB
MKAWFLKVMPWALLAVFAADIVAILLPRPEGEFHLQEFGRLPVLANGRVQPFDSLGRNSLLQIRGTASVPLAEKKGYEFWKHPPKLRGAEWLLEVMTRPEVADTRPVFLIHHPELLGELNLQDKGVEKSGLRYFAYNDLTNVLGRIEAEGRQAMGVEAQARTAYQRQVVKLFNAVALYRRLKFTLQPEGTEDMAAELKAFQESIGPGLAALRARQAGREYDREALDRLVGFLQRYDVMAQLAYPWVVPPPSSQAPREHWHNLGRLLFEIGLTGGTLPPSVGWLAEMATAYRQQDAARFNRAVAEYRDWLALHAPAELRKSRAEFWYNQLQAFLHAMIIYMFAFLLAAGAMLTVQAMPAWSESLRRSAFLLALLAVAVHTAGLAFRVWLERRPPVTNLYSSAVFVGWAVTLLGVGVERAYRMGLGVAASALVGFVTLLIAHNLALGGDTMEMMRAVLDSNFWLATHVITITLGYAAVFFAGFLGILYVVLGVFTPLLAHPLRGAERAPRQHPRPFGPDDMAAATVGHALAKMIYAVICFGTLFSFAGTVLGGIWADQSWGRFWGWDPKENGALMIVLWCAAILHARWGGLIRARGLANMAIFGNVVTAFSWFGTNMLGIGLHSYGFMDAAFRWLLLFYATQLAVIALGLLPLEKWRSFRRQPGLQSSEAVAAAVPSPGS